MRLKACHFHRYCHSPSPRPSHLATSLAPRHPTLPTPLLPPSFTPLSKHKIPHPVLHSHPHPVPTSLYARDAAGSSARKPDVMQSIMQNKHMARGHHSGGELDGRNQDEDQWRRRNRSRRTRSAPLTHGTTHGPTHRQLLSSNTSHSAHRNTACVPHMTHVQPSH